MSCEKLRADDVAKTAALAHVRDVASGLEFRRKLEPVEAISRVRDAMVRFGANGVVMTGRGAPKKFHLH